MYKHNKDMPKLIIAIYALETQADTTKNCAVNENGRDEESTAIEKHCAKVYPMAPYETVAMLKTLANLSENEYIGRRL